MIFKNLLTSHQTVPSCSFGCEDKLLYFKVFKLSYFMYYIMYISIPILIYLECSADYI